ncbi:MAG: heme NO-binding domain-containing protein [bacterium]|jgi:hypothetical protein|nr:heme NO-binding domain-containing protein [Betaproteobacteria bacterium]
MKGMVFTEFLELVERTWSPAMADDLVDACELQSGGAYTSVGTYDHREMVKLVVELAARTGQRPDDVLHWFGGGLFGSLAASFPRFVEGYADALSMLAGIEAVIHVEVRKLYPDAELPVFEVSRQDARTLVLDYRSPRCMDALAHGLIDACVRQFGGGVQVRRAPLGPTHADGSRFTLVRE